MTITKGFVLNKLMKCLAEIGAMQKNGSLWLPEKVAYALAKNASECTKVLNSFNELKRSLLELHVEKDTENNTYLSAPDDKGEVHWIFLSGGEVDHKAAFIKAQDDFFNTVCISIFHGLSEDIISQVPNFPLDAFVILSEAGIIKEQVIQVVGAGALKVAN